MRTLDNAKYSELVSSKFVAFGQAMNAGFNKLNKLESIADPGEKVSRLHALILNGIQFEESEFTEADYVSRQAIVDEETRRVKALISGELKAYSPSEKELEILVINPSEVLDCMITEDDYINELKTNYSDRG